MTPTQTISRLFGYSRPYLSRLAVAALLLAAAGALMSAVVATGKPLVNRVLFPAPPAEAPPAAVGSGFDILDTARAVLPANAVSGWDAERAFVQVPLLLVAIFFVRGVLLYFGEYLTTHAGVAVVRDLRRDLFDAIVHQSLRFFQSHPTGVILARVLNDVQRLQKVTTTVLADLVRVGTMVPFLVAVVFVTDWRMSLFALVALPVLAFPMVKLGARLRRAATRSQESLGEAASLLTESVAGAKVVQGFAMERFEAGRFGTALAKMMRADLKAGRAAALAPSLMELFGAAAGAALFYVAGKWIHEGRLDPGAFWVVLAGLGLLFMSIRRLNALNVEIQQGLAAAVRVFAMLDRETEVREAEGAPDLSRSRGEIRFESVDFAYDGERVLAGIDLSIRPGEIVALVGASGSGKSTLANLVPRFYDVTGGRVLVDGFDVREVTIRSLREQIGLVTQETVLFDDTVRNNIAYGRADVPLDRVVEVARAAQAHEFVERLAEGYDTPLGERGARLSMGQRQRLTIARALLKDPPILILDEATSALDSESEALVGAALEELMRGRTSIVIAHRLATVRRADRIVVLDEGRIVEQGTHEELLDLGGVYARLHALQFEGASA